MRIEVAIILIMLSACNNAVTDYSENNPLIKAELDQRRSAYQLKKLKECRAATIDRAKMYVDSLISARISYQLSDSIVFPPKPEKPSFPGPIVIQDTVRSKPFIISDTEK
ncbi:MAG TPA: hypothetical protein PK611_02805 [Saprospiraceae bacterium]|jgi:hypothetical protein|nr:hypothetical protein [Saprospiraceae bacterium]HRO08292.1 hypothetical protein [Saprospiraceae bacterium]HRO72578.1 hypothetical protein [Saprospiraceae bacterium]HRP41759.1 hypothetical protein [Saprospiraceae bacterium]